MGKHHTFESAVLAALTRATLKNAFHAELETLNDVQRAVIHKAMKNGWVPKRIDESCGTVWMDHPNLETFMKIDDQGRHMRVKAMRVEA